MAHTSFALSTANIGRNMILLLMLLRVARRWNFIFFMLAELMLKLIHFGLDLGDTLFSIVTKFTHFCLLLFHQFWITLSESCSHFFYTHSICGVFEKTSNRHSLFLSVIV